MQINITGRHLQITDDIRSHIEKRASKIQGIFSSILDLHIVIEHEKNRYFTEITLAMRLATFHAQSETYDLFISLDTVMDKIEKQIRRHKERVKDWRHRQPQRDAITQLHDEEELPLAEVDTDAPLQFVRTPSKFASKPMTVEDAAMQLQISGDLLLLFLNSETNQINLLYETDGETYGWVEPHFT